MNESATDYSEATGTTVSGKDRGSRSSKGGRPVGEMLYGLKEARVQADLAVRTLAEKASLTERTIYKLESLNSGAAPRTTLRLAKALGVRRRVLREEPEEED